MTRGWQFPVSISGEHGRVMTSRNKENIRQSVTIILMTEPGERLMHPQFGTKLHQFLFEGMNSQTEEMIRREVCHSLYTWEDRITDIEVRAYVGQQSQGTLHVSVSYRIVETAQDDQVEIVLEE